MPRQARKKSETGIYHIMLRGINRQQIFEDAEDYEKFLQVLKECKAISEFELFAYCLMGNHVHILIKPHKEPLELIFKRIGSRYVYCYNWKYHRTGHLFQDRYKSEPIDDENYFFAVLRYIHQNPIKAKFCKKLSDYPFSSYMAYKETDYTNFVDTEFAFKISDKSSLLDFFNQYSDEQCLDITEMRRLNDNEARAIIKEVSGCKDITQFQLLPIDKRNRVIHKLKKSGLSIRQISRLTGVSFNIVRKF